MRVYNASLPENKLEFPVQCAGNSASLDSNSIFSLKCGVQLFFVSIVFGLAVIAILLTSIVSVNAQTTPRLTGDDNTSLPLVSVSPVDDSIEEGNVAKFRVTASEAVSSDTIVNVNTNFDNVTLWRQPKQVLIKSGTRTARLSFPTSNVNGDEGLITLEINNGNGYEPFNPTSATVKVIGQDEETDSQASGAVAEAAIEAILAFISDNSTSNESALSINVPKISVVAVTNRVDEGSPVQFRISSNKNLPDDFVVEYTLTPEGNFFDDLGDEVKRIKLTTVRQTALVEIPTIDDKIVEQDGALTLKLLDGHTYDLSDQSNAKVVVSDFAD